MRNNRRKHKNFIGGRKKFRNRISDGRLPERLRGTFQREPGRRGYYPQGHGRPEDRLRHPRGRNNNGLGLHSVLRRKKGKPAESLEGGNGEGNRDDRRGRVRERHRGRGERGDVELRSGDRREDAQDKTRGQPQRAFHRAIQDSRRNYDPPGEERGQDADDGRYFLCARDLCHNREGPRGGKGGVFTLHGREFPED